MMDWYYYIALVIILSQLLFSVQTYNNYRYALNKYKKKRLWYRPRTALFVPCKGLDSDFQKNITSFFNQDYENYLLWFVVADKSDPAYDELCKLKNRLSQSSKAQDVQIFVAGAVRSSTSRQQSPKGKIPNGAGQGQSCSQKIHNLLYCYERIVRALQTQNSAFEEPRNDGKPVEVLAFVDSDVCVRSDWLSHIVYPLRKSKNGAASGYRWFIPKKNNVASLALSAVNAKVAQLLGNTHFNQAWGGSMAIRADLFAQVGLDKIWAKTLSDDLSLSGAVKKAGKKVVFVPACLVASYESVTWRRLFEFGRRQFLITRISSGGIWWFGLCSSLYSVLGLWGTAALAVYAAMIGAKNLPLFAAVPILFFVSGLGGAILRQKMGRKLLQKDYHKMHFVRAADILFFWVWSLLLLVLIISSAFGKTILWRGIRYKLLGPTETIVVGD